MFRFIAVNFTVTFLPAHRPCEAKCATEEPGIGSVFFVCTKRSPRMPSCFSFDRPHRTTYPPFHGGSHDSEIVLRDANYHIDSCVLAAKLGMSPPFGTPPKTGHFFKKRKRHQFFFE